jgi:lipopolysaccharide heptosyltransferase II
VKRILVVNVNWLGDALFSTPAIRALRKHHLSDRIECLAPPRCVEVLKDNPHLDDVLAWSDDTRFVSIFDTLRLVGELKKRKFDRAYFFHGSNTKVFAAMLAGIPERIGIAPAGKGRFLTRAVLPAPGRPHKIDYFLHFLSAQGIKDDGRFMDYVPEDSRASLRKLLAGAGIAEGEPFVVMHAGGNWDLKRWSEKHFAEWIRLFYEKTGWKTVLCGTRSETALAEGIVSSAGADKARSLCGRTSLSELAWLLSTSRFIISNDSGPIHLAASQRVKILGVFGPTSAAQTGPVSEAPVAIARVDTGCEIPCYFKSCDHRLCMDAIDPVRVAEMAEELLGELR